MLFRSPSSSPALRARESASAPVAPEDEAVDLGGIDIEVSRTEARDRATFVACGAAAAGAAASSGEAPNKAEARASALAAASWAMMAKRSKMLHGT